VVDGAFGLLASLSRLGSARVSELQRDCGLPRTTVQRLLVQLEEVGAAERSADRWQLGPAMVRLGTEIPAQPRLRSLARRPLMDLARAAGAYVGFSVEVGGLGMVIEALPGATRLAVEPDPGAPMDKAQMATARAFVQARRGNLRPVIEAGEVHPKVSCVAVPLRLPARKTAAVWLMVPGAAGVPAPLVVAAGRTAARITAAATPPPGYWLPDR
jgi:DNA-binding IclR family transcriptional regulator